MNFLSPSLFTAMLLFTGSIVFAQPQADRIIGIYYTPKKDGKISIYKRGSQYFGKLIWGAKNFKDSKNPNVNLRSRNVVGSDFLYGFVHKNGEYTDGKIYDPTSGRTYSASLWMEGNALKVRGFIGISAFGRTETFAKAGK